MKKKYFIFLFFPRFRNRNKRIFSLSFPLRLLEEFSESEEGRMIASLSLFILEKLLLHFYYDKTVCNTPYFPWTGINMLPFFYFWYCLSSWINFENACIAIAVGMCFFPKHSREKIVRVRVYIHMVVFPFDQYVQYINSTHFPVFLLLLNHKQ
jgi:hypothetical protein